VRRNREEEGGTGRKREEQGGTGRNREEQGGTGRNREEQGGTGRTGEWRRMEKGRGREREGGRKYLQNLEGSGDRAQRPRNIFPQKNPRTPSLRKS
jgi:hypothetical protein